MLLQGLAFLHSHGVIVMDIKPDNIFCNRTGTFQIGDFGMAIVSSLNWVRVQNLAKRKPKHGMVYIDPSLLTQCHMTGMQAGGSSKVKTLWHSMLCGRLRFLCLD